MSTKRNWDKINERNVTDTVAYRDVYEDQQLDRSKIEKKQGPLSRIIFCVIVAVLAAILVYTIWSLIEFANGSINVVSQQGSVSVESISDRLYYKEISEIDPMTGMHSKYQAVDENGEPFGEFYDNIKDVPIPDWYSTGNADINGGEVNTINQESDIGYYFGPSFLKVIISLALGFGVFSILYQVMMRNLEAQNMMNDTSDINQYQNDQHIALPEEVQRKFDWFPDVGAHSNVQVSSMISHMALTNKGLNKIQVAKRAEKDILDEDGDVEYYKGEVLYDDDGNVVTELKPMIDTKFMDDLFTASGAPDDKSIRKYYDTTSIPYNPGNKNREKLKNYNTVADLINNDWTFPEYEPQRPAGAYIVDTAPVNTMV